MTDVKRVFVFVLRLKVLISGLLSRGEVGTGFRVRTLTHGPCRRLLTYAAFLPARDTYHSVGFGLPPLLTQHRSASVSASANMGA